jgi:hypothetical protein
MIKFIKSIFHKKRMKKELFVLLILSLAITGIALNSLTVIADEGDSESSSDDSKANSNSGSSADEDDSDEKEDDSDSDDEKDDDSRLSSISEMKKERIREKIESETRLADGSKVKIKREVRIEDGKVEVKIERKVTDANGIERKVEIRVEKEGNETRKIVIKRENSIEETELEIEDELEVDDDVDDSDSEIEVRNSLGETTRIKILPDTASEIALERLKAKNLTKVELKEVLHKNVPRVVYRVETSQNGKFLGVFKLSLKGETQIDPETGEVIDMNVPWWAFLVAKEDIDGDSDESQDSAGGIEPTQLPEGEQGEVVPDEEDEEDEGETTASSETNSSS